MPVRWNSTHSMLERLLYLRPEFAGTTPCCNVKYIYLLIRLIG